MKKGLDYRQAGVDIEKGNQLVTNIKGLAKSTFRKEVLSGLGGFGGLFEVPIDRYKKPVLVSGTDGVGTKLKLAIEADHHQGIGVDLVAMCVNDLIVSGAEPLYFLDYYATGKLSLTTAETIIASIAEGCKQSGMALIGGETAEMPGMYQQSDYDLAGFAVGIVEKANIITGDKVKAGDKLIAMGSTGPHSNGYSLIRKVLEVNGLDLSHELLGKTLKEHLLAPTKIYVRAVEALKQVCDIHALSHITGGGLTENLPRVMPENTQAMIDLNTWQWPQIFQFLQAKGNIEQEEMLRTFNCGIGMVAIVASNELENAQQALAQCDIDSWCCGEIIASDNQQPSVDYQHG